jgi:hypothetical protein
MFEKIFLAIAIVCSLYLNIQVKSSQKVAETGAVAPVEVTHEGEQSVLPKI